MRNRRKFCDFCNALVFPDGWSSADNGYCKDHLKNKHGAKAVCMRRKGIVGKGVEESAFPKPSKTVANLDNFDTFGKL